MKEQSANKLDKLFKEKLQHAEISPEDNYWPFIEQKINKPSFLKFGWRHINIYNLSISILLISFAVLLLTETKPKENPTPIDTIQNPSSMELKGNPTLGNPLNLKSENSKKKTSTPLKTITPAEKTIVDSTPLTPSTKVEEFTVTKDTVTIKPVEKKKKPKEIIYIIQQDTIIEKDTVKVRRLRKK